MANWSRNLGLRVMGGPAAWDAATRITNSKARAADIAVKSLVRVMILVLQQKEGWGSFFYV